MSPAAPFFSPVRRAFKQSVRHGMHAVQAAGYGLSHLFFPRCCAACGCVCSQEEAWLCLACEAALPWTDYHRESGHRLERQFWGRAPLVYAWAAWHMAQEGPVRRILHTLKYRQRPDLAREAGRVYAKRLLADGCGTDLDGLAFVPMAPAKERARGYNPAREIAVGMAGEWALPIHDRALTRQRGGASQTRKDRADRWSAVSKLYTAGPSLRPGSGLEQMPLHGQHILLVDDVVTSGATLEACALPLQRAGARVSIVALAAAD